MNHSPISRRPDQRGTSVLEALVAMLVLAVGLVGVARFQGPLRLNGEVARQRAEALRLAQAEIESLRAFTTLAATPGGRAFDPIASMSRRVDASPGDGTTTRYDLAREVATHIGPGEKSVRVRATWSDRAGAIHEVVLDTLIAAADPAFTGALGLARGGDPTRGPFGRSLQVPLPAVDLGDGTSALKPVDGGTLAVRFDNRSGRVTARCPAVAPGLPGRLLTAAALGPCAALSGQWLSGVVRFSSALPPDANAANDTPPALSVALALAGPTGAPLPTCTTEAMKGVAFDGTGGRRIEAVPLTASPASLGLTGWADTGERFVAYHCLIESAPGAAWSGRLAIVPVGWRIGTAAGERRVCRHSSDLDGSGAIDTALEHPLDYAGVTGNLQHQNHLVIDAAAACPGGRALRIAGDNASDVYVDLGTLPHSP